MSMKQDTLEVIKDQLKKLKDRDSFYRKKYDMVDCAGVEDEEDFRKLPFTEKKDLRDAYPLGLMAGPEDEIVRIHSSSGTTGLPIIIPYTAQDIDDWAVQFARCYDYAGLTRTDRVQITPGYGLWTAGIGFQAGCEKFGAMAIPMGPGNTEKQLQMMMDLKSTVLCSTSSYALLLAEEIEKRGIKDRICLKHGIIGSERWGEKMRNRIAESLGIDLFDIYGLTEIYGPGIAINCRYNTGMHYWDDYVYIEVIDPVTLQEVPDGQSGELVITTLRKQGAPLIRYRTHDISMKIPETSPCPCGSPYPRIGQIVGRTDDMMKVKGCNIFPGQIEDILKDVDDASSEYQVIIDHEDGKDVLTLKVETIGDAKKLDVENEIAAKFKSKIGMTPRVKAVDIGDLPRSEKKTKRVIDKRFE